MTFFDLLRSFLTHDLDSTLALVSPEIAVFPIYIAEVIVL
jgi:hypothetical protein